MELRADFARREVVDTTALPWVPSPVPGVDRRLLDRVGDEVARATSVVRYARGSAFDPHEHGRGEEFLVLDGTFEDEHGRYPAGTYVRNPPGSTHAPRAPEGCCLLVKLRQMRPDQDRRVVVAPGSRRPVPDAAGRDVVELYVDRFEAVSLERWPPGAAVDTLALGGEELLVLDGALHAATGEVLSPGAWVRSPAGARLTRHSPGGAWVWVKRGHLGEPVEASWA
jgi:anti-sigma factor ChrR (cupin superfamily)